MKKLGKLLINPEKVMKREELINLRGGDPYGGSGVNCCFCSFWGYMVGTTQADCNQDCQDAGMGSGSWVC
jgi:hypothetical protein